MIESFDALSSETPTGLQNKQYINEGETCDNFSYFNSQRKMYSRCLRADGGSITPKKDATLTFMDDVV
jgi:hypothetical protein